MIKIGVTPCMFYPNEDRSSFAPKRLNYLVEDMGIYLNRHNVLPILIPSLSYSDLSAFVKEMDGIVFQGGDDVAPESYGEKPIGKWKGDRKRDEIELEIMRLAIDYDKPIFAICRGLQLMNVFFGGTLYQDLPSQISTSTLHKGQNYDQNVHEIKIKEGSFLEEINNGRISKVNSVHHQAIKKIADNLEALAWDMEEEIIEAVQYKDREEGRVMGVQWHPEFDWNHHEDLFPGEKLYDHFLKCCE